MQIFPAVKPGWTRRNYRAFGFSHPAWSTPAGALPGVPWLGEGNVGFFFLETPSSCFTLSFLLPAHQDCRAESSRDLPSLNFYSCFCLWRHFSNRVEVLQNTAKTPNSWILDWPHGKATSGRALSQWFWGAGREIAAPPNPTCFPSLWAQYEKEQPQNTGTSSWKKKSWRHSRSGKVFMIITWKCTQKGQKESAKERSHSPLWEIFSQGISKHKRKRLKINYYFVFLFKHASERMCGWDSAPRMQPVGICLNQDYFSYKFLLRICRNIWENWN